MEQTKIGIIGCGVISNTYIRDIQRFYDKLYICACADVDTKLAAQHAAKYHIPTGCSVDELLSMDEIEIVVNLTPPQFHTEINRKILLAGRHLFCEKPFALTVEDAEEILQLAREKGLAVGSAPDTFMGSSLQTCNKLLRDGWIGKPLYATANMMSGGVETWHPAPANFYKEGAGPLYDMGPYYFTALTTLLGPLKSICAFSGTGFSNRRVYTGPYKGTTVPVETPTHYSGMAQLESGVIVSMNFSFDIWHSNLPMLEIYGTEGTLEVPDPNMSGGRPKVYRKERTLDTLYCDSEEAKAKLHVSAEVPELFPNIGEYTRGAGILDLAAAIREGRPPRACGALACHVIDAITGMMRSAESHEIYNMKTTCVIPDALHMGMAPGEI